MIRPREPVEILSEYDSEGWEIRKVEIFPDGSLGYADSSGSSGGMGLSLILRPPDDEVVSAREFEVADLTGEEFERAWKEARESAMAKSNAGKSAATRG